MTTLATTPALPRDSTAGVGVPLPVQIAGPATAVISTAITDQRMLPPTHHMDTLTEEDFKPSMEELHVLGRIQPHGFLVAVQESSEEDALQALDELPPIGSGAGAEGDFGDANHMHDDDRSSTPSTPQEAGRRIDAQLPPSASAATAFPMRVVSWNLQHLVSKSSDQLINAPLATLIGTAQVKRLQEALHGCRKLADLQPWPCTVQVRRAVVAATPAVADVLRDRAAEEERVQRLEAARKLYRSGQLGLRGDSGWGDSGGTWAGTTPSSPRGAAAEDGSVDEAMPQAPSSELLSPTLPLSVANAFAGPEFLTEEQEEKQPPALDTVVPIPAAEAAQPAPTQPAETNHVRAQGGLPGARPVDPHAQRQPNLPFPPIPEPSVPAVSGPFQTQTFDVCFHRSGGLLVLEFEPSHTPQTAASTQAAFRRQMLASIAAMQSAPNFQTCLRRCAREVRKVVGYDRCMVYRFHADGSGEVVAESKTAAFPLDSFLGLMYPSTDIPPQARALYVRNKFRMIGDVSFAGVQLVPQLNPLTAAPFDLTFAGLRSVHPIHLQYLRNMGVRSSLSISIVINGALWGLIACHHYRSSRYLDYESRAIAEQLGDLMATQIPHHLQRERLAQTTALRANLDVLLHNMMDANTQWPLALAAEKDVLLRLFDASGVVIVADGKMSSIGQVPTHAQLLPLTSFLIAQAASGIYSTSHLSSVYPPASAYTGPASGVLAILLSALDGDVICFFRPEIVSTVGWGGRPTDSNGHEYLTPRNSFAVWTAEKRGHSREWSSATADIAGDLKRFLLEVKLIYLAREGEAKERSKFLFAEELRRKQIDFIDKICHEIRNPINGIMGSISIMRDEMNDMENKLMAQRSSQSVWDRATSDDRRAGKTVDGTALVPVSSGAAASALSPGVLLSHLTELHANLNNIDECVQHQKVIADDVLGLSKLEHARVSLELQPFDLAETVQRALAMYEAIVKLKKLKLTLDYGCIATHVKGDPTRLKQIIANILNNAVKFTEHGTISVTVSQLAPATVLVSHTSPVSVRDGPPLPLGGAAIVASSPPTVAAATPQTPETPPPGTLCEFEIKIRDSGIGMSPAQLQTLFQPYSQATTKTSLKYGGSGLGLCIARELARLMGGDVTVTSEVGVGSEFRLTVFFEPLSAAAAQKWQERQAAAEAVDRVAFLSPATDRPDQRMRSVGSSGRSDFKLFGITDSAAPPIVPVQPISKLKEGSISHGEEGMLPLPSAGTHKREVSMESTQSAPARFAGSTSATAALTKAAPANGAQLASAAASMAHATASAAEVAASAAAAAKNAARMAAAASVAYTSAVNTQSVPPGLPAHSPSTHPPQQQQSEQLQLAQIQQLMSAASSLSGLNAQNDMLAGMNISDAAPVSSIQALPSVAPAPTKSHPAAAGLTVQPNRVSVALAPAVRIPSTPSGSTRRLGGLSAAAAAVAATAYPSPIAAASPSTPSLTPSGAGTATPIRPAAVPGTPAASPSGPVSTPTKVSGPVGWNPRVLIVEDNSINARVLKRSLEIMHCKCEWAQHGLEGVTLFANARATAQPFDVVFTDVEMPIMGGLEATMRMRQIEREEASGPSRPATGLPGGGSAHSTPALLGGANSALLPELSLPASAGPAFPAPTAALPSSPPMIPATVSPSNSATLTPTQRNTPPLTGVSATLPSPRRTFIACVSGNVRDEFVHAARLAGVDTYIGKPFSREGLAAALHAARAARDMEER